MTVELHADDEAARLLDVVADDARSDRERPHVSGDLPSVLDSAPMFRRAVVGYDRFQVDTYVQWAEDELATADRERRHLEARHLATRAALADAEQLLAHSSSGGEFLQLSRRLGEMLATAADEAESMHAAAQADRAAASERATRMAEHAERLLAAAGAEAGRTVLAASSEAQAMAAEARRTVAEAEATLAAAAAEVAARLAEVRALEHRAADTSAEVLRQAGTEAQAARLRARSEIVAMLGAGREQRRRADAEALAARERLDAEAVDRRTFLRQDVARLEQLRTALLAEVDLLAAAVAERRRPRFDVRLRSLPESLRWGARSLRAP